ncbi:MAG: hypothetical protein JSU62_02125, partial [Gammaproteobacteria bacterium]
QTTLSAVTKQGCCRRSDAVIPARDGFENAHDSLPASNCGVLQRSVRTTSGAYRQSDCFGARQRV